MFTTMRIGKKKAIRKQNYYCCCNKKWFMLQLYLAFILALHYEI
jgi:hypothetical protein